MKYYCNKKDWFSMTKGAVGAAVEIETDDHFCPRCCISPAEGVVFDLWHSEDWPESRIDLIGQNGNDGLHYETTGNAGDRMNGGDTSQSHERLNAGSDTMTGGEQ